uniref:Uncharacterized protein n=1 Tax=Peronospora matthiolae TaxID=2874970 RepID=A0AAV1TUA8_9STRA
MATTSPDIRAAADVACTAFEDTVTEEVPRMSQLADDSSAVLFFDGGSRGNPGPGGAGAIIITNAGSLESAGVRWMCSVSLAASTTTHNAAAYKALPLGFARRWGTIYNAYTSFGTAMSIGGGPAGRGHVDSSPSTFKKMANAMAKIAMDSGRSIQVLGPEVALLPSEWAVVTTYLRSDLVHWHDTLWDTARQANRQRDDPR